MGAHPTGGHLFGALLCAALFAAPTARAQSGSVSGEVKISVVGPDGKAMAKPDRSNVVVYLTGYTEPPPAQSAAMLQRNKKFEPDVLPIVKDQVVVFDNKDALLHNVFSSSKARKFDLGKYGAGKKEVTFPSTGVVDVYCDIHESMIGTVLVLPNRAFAKTDKDGRFRIDGVRPGAGYTLFAWHRRGLPAKVENVKVDPNGALRLTLELSETLVEEPHLDKYGRPYKQRAGYEKN